MSFDAQARLAMIFDTTSLLGGMQALDMAERKSRTVGAAADMASMSLTKMGAGLAQQTRMQTQEMRELQAAAEAWKRSLAEITSPAYRTHVSPEAHAASIQRAQTMVTAYEGQIRKLQGVSTTAATEQGKLNEHFVKTASAVDVANGKFTMMTGIVGGLTGAFAFGLGAAILGVLRQIASIPVETARAADSFNMLQARLTFSLNGSRATARQAYADILDIARDTGVSLDQVGAGFSQMAVAGRTIGMTRQQTSDISRSFNMLALTSGATPVQAQGALYQFQQAVSYGRLTSQDFRFMIQNMPGLRPVLAEGLGTTQSGMMRQMREGSIDGRDMVDALQRALPKIEEEFARLVPETMDRAHGQIITEWQELMHDLGDAFKTSPFFQSLQRRVSTGIRDWDVGAFGTAKERYDHFSERARDRSLTGVEREWARRAALLAFPGAERENRLRAEGQAITPGSNNPVAPGAIGSLNRGFLEGLASFDEAQEQNRSRIEEALSYGAEFNPFLYARRSLEKRISRMRATLDLNPSEQDRGDITNYIGLAEARLATLTTSLERMGMQTRQGRADLRTYGPGGFDMAREARGLMLSSASEGNVVGMPTAMNAILERRVLEEQARAGGEALSLDVRRRILLPAAGLSAAARRQAGLDAQVEEFAGRFGSAASDPRVQGLIGERRALIGGQAAYEDASAQAEREAGEARSLRHLRERLALDLRLGVEGKVQLAQQQRMHEIQQLNYRLTEEQLAAEMARVEAGVRMEESLRLQERQYALLVDSAQTAAGAIGGAFRSGISEGIRTGVLRGSVALEALANSAARIIDNIMQRMMSPFERQLENVIGNFADGLFGGSGTFTAAPVINVSPIAFGAAFSSGVRKFAMGHVVTSPEYFAFGGGIGLRGEAGEEAVIPLKRGMDGKLGVGMHGGGSPAPIINIIDQRGSDAPAVQTRESSGPNGERMIEVLIEDKVNAGLQAGRFDRSMSGRFGAQRRIERT